MTYPIEATCVLCPSVQLQRSTNMLLQPLLPVPLMSVIDVLDLTEAGLIQPAKKAHPRVSPTITLPCTLLTPNVT